MRAIIVAAMLGLAAFAGLAAAEPAFTAAQMPPRDDAAQDAEFQKFRSTLQQIVWRKDKDALLAALAPDIMFSFGGDAGREAFAKNFALDDRKSAIWDELDRLLALGTVRDEEGGGYWAPALYGAWPEEFDAFEFLAVTVADAPLREAPRGDAKVIRPLRFDIVQRDLTVEERTGESEAPEWVAVILADGTKGFIATKFVRSPIDYRAHFIKQNGAWMMDVLVAGD